MPHYRWKVTCQFRNAFLTQNNRTDTFEVTASTERDAKKAAQAKMCTSLGLSTMMHSCVSVLSVEQIGRA